MTSAVRQLALTASAMIAFAANSLLCRQALGAGLIDPASFSTVRVVAGALLLAVLAQGRQAPGAPKAGGLPAAALLFGYVACFSFAYVSLGAGTGALILFGAVQLTMFAAALRAGERFGLVTWLGLAAALGGLVLLVAPGVTAPDPVGALLMTLAGIAWGGYSLLGRSGGDPLAATARNFLLAVPLVLLVSLVSVGSAAWTPSGLLLAIASGALASGVGYALWYAALPGLTAGQAATVQLSVPAITAFGGIVLLGETLTLRLALASFVTLGGVALALRR